MRIGFCAPLKAPDHPVPSGDRQMARNLMRALGLAGHDVSLISRLRTYCAEPDADRMQTIAIEARAEIERIAARWRDDRPPDLLFAYHPFYKAPDLVAYPLAAMFGRPYVTAEASHAGKRATGPWAGRHREVERAIRAAAINFHFTARDRAGLVALAADERLAPLPPFIDASRYPAPTTVPNTAGPLRLVSVAMMRSGDKARSYAFLAQALACLGSIDWHLTIVGDGPARAEVEAAFAHHPKARIEWLGVLEVERIAALLSRSDLFVWPGFNEAYGLCYLEAQACGCPVVAIHNAGTPSVIEDHKTGRLTPPDLESYAQAIRELAADPVRRRAYGGAGAAMVRTDRTIEAAARRLDEGLKWAMTAIPA